MEWTEQALRHFGANGGDSDVENALLRKEIRVSREAAEITARLVVEQFERTEATLARLEQAADEMTAIFEASTFGITFVKNRMMLKVNRKMEELFGHASGGLAGQPTRCLFPDDAIYLSVGEAYRELAEGKTHRRILQMHRKDGSLFWARLSGVAISNDESRGSVWTIEDITTEYEATVAMREAKEKAEAAEARLRESYDELEGANERLRELDKLKSDFLSSVSHELRTPLTSIRGFASLIEREFARSFAPQAAADAGLQKKSLRIQDNLKIILKESERLTRLINDVLDLAKIESGRTEWRDTVLPVADFMRDAANAAQGMFEHKPEVTLRLDIAPALPPFFGDADRMQQVLVNLLNNAAKFTDCGEVLLRAWQTEEGMLQIDIRDQGIGFSPEDAESIFDKFQQAKQGDTLMDRPKGTGLGLAICREIVNRHGGRIWATSEPGVGSTFSIRLPVATAEQIGAGKDASGHTEAPAGAAGCSSAGQQRHSGRTRVLVVDDDLAVRDYFTQLLQEQGCEVVTAPDGEAALTAAREQRPDLITMDLSMPVMDGRTAIRLLRADAELKRIPIMVISAIPGWESAGGDLAMSKPPDEKRFIENIHALLREGRGEDLPMTKVDFLVLYEEGHVHAAVPESFAACCQVGFCPVDDLTARIRAGFQGMVAIPVDLLHRVDIDFLHSAPSLKVLIMPVTGGGPSPLLACAASAPPGTDGP